MPIVEANKLDQSLPTLEKFNIELTNIYSILQGQLYQFDRLHMNLTGEHVISEEPAKACADPSIGTKLSHFALLTELEERLVALCSSYRIGRTPNRADKKHAINP